VNHNDICLYILDECISDPPVATQPQASREQLLTHWLSSEGFSREQLLAVAAMLTNEIREAVRTETGFTCSAGISHNKVHTYVYVYVSILHICTRLCKSW